MQNIDYLKIFRDAWKITWKNRFLWWFGLFTITTGFSGFSFPSENKEAPQKDWQDFTEKINWQQFLSDHIALIITAVVILTVLIFITLVLSFISKGALIKSTQKILKNEPANFSSGFQDGKKYFWRIVSILFFSGLIASISVFILVAPVMILFNAKSYIIGGILAFFAVLILIPLIVLCKYLQIYASFYVVLADLKAWAAIENAYVLFRRNILPSIIMSLLFIPVGIVAFFAILALVFIILLIFGLIGLALFFTFEEIGAIIAIAGALLVLIPFALLFSAIFKAFSEIAWVLFFHVIATPKETEKVIEEITAEEKSSTLPTAETMKTAKTEK